MPADHVLCSDLARARETAEILGVEVARFDPRWRETDVGRGVRASRPRSTPKEVA